jgi:helix-turn-helix protein
VSGAGSADWWDREPQSVEPRPLIDDIEPGDQPSAPPLTVGGWLRAEREGQGLGLDDVETVTRIRAGQLRALEDNRFDALPGTAYARAFVRSYAEHLGLDATRAATMFDQQQAPQQATADQNSPPAGYPGVTPVRRGRDRVAWSAAALATLMAIASAAVFLLGGRSNGADTTRGGGSVAAPARRAASSATTGTATTGAAATQPRPTEAVLLVRATNGPCWIEAHAGRETGPLLAMETLEPGQQVRLRARRIWIRLGNPTAAHLVENGHPTTLPNTATPLDLTITAHHHPSA